MLVFLELKFILWIKFAIQSSVGVVANEETKGREGTVVEVLVEKGRRKLRERERSHALTVFKGGVA
ncbi:hypothetical protein U1Q18_013118 [Sarracenia purpurea var. burkii]